MILRLVDAMSNNFAKKGSYAKTVKMLYNFSALSSSFWFEYIDLLLFINAQFLQGLQVAASPCIFISLAVSLLNNIERQTSKFRLLWVLKYDI